MATSDQHRSDDELDARIHPRDPRATARPTGGTATRTRRSGASFGTTSNYNRMLTTFPGAPTTAPAELEAAARRQLVVVGRGDLAPPAPGPASGTAHAATGTKRFTADGALNKAGLLGLMALVVGAVSYIANLPIGAGLGDAVRRIRRRHLVLVPAPPMAPVLAPVYAVAEGVVLGIISRFYADQGSHTVTLAVFGTVAVVAGVWAVYRTGLVRVGHRFFMITLVAGVGMLVVMMTSILTGWGLSGTGGLIIFGVLYLILAVMNLFVDFSFVDRAQAAGIEADAEWFSAFTILVSSVMVYLALLRIFGGSRYRGPDVGRSAQAVQAGGSGRRPMAQAAGPAGRLRPTGPGRGSGRQAVEDESGGVGRGLGPGRGAGSPARTAIAP